MKALLISFFLIGTLNLNAQLVEIPDSNFLQLLLSYSGLDQNQDGQIQITEAANFSGFVNCNDCGIVDFTGIEAFPKIRSLQIYDTEALSLDLSNCPNLSVLELVRNKFQELSITAMPNLKGINLEQNELVALDFSENPQLEKSINKSKQTRNCKLNRPFQLS